MREYSELLCMPSLMDKGESIPSEEHWIDKVGPIWEIPTP
jgi:hypothetical protein